MIALETPRLRLRELRADDAPFAVELLNDPEFLRYIGDRGVRTEADALGWMQKGPLASYASHGYGLLRVELRASGVPIGLCGLVRRPALAHADLGFAFLPGYRSQGHAFEAATAVLQDARERLGLTRILAIVQPDNAASIRLLQRLGLRSAGTVRLADSEPELLLYGRAD